MAIEFGPEQIDSLEKLILALMKCHEDRDYKKLLELSGENPENPQNPVLSEDDFLQACEVIRTKFGSLENLNYLANLDKGNMIQTLWCAKYQGTPLEILWQIYFMRQGATLKITGLWFN